MSAGFRPRLGPGPGPGSGPPLVLLLLLVPVPASVALPVCVPVGSPGGSSGGGGVPPALLLLRGRRPLLGAARGRGRGAGGLGRGGGGRGRVRQQGQSLLHLERRDETATRERLIGPFLGRCRRTGSRASTPARRGGGWASTLCCPLPVLPSTTPCLYCIPLKQATVARPRC